MRGLGVKSLMKVIQKDIKLGLELVLFGLAGTVKGVLVNICTQSLKKSKYNCCRLERVITYILNVFGVIHLINGYWDSEPLTGQRYL